MKRQIAVKKLTASDLTLFKYHFQTAETGGNQKAINLNADVFVARLYPELPEITSGKLSIDLFIYGPGGAPELNLQRKIIKQGSYKNWRLDGEFIDDPVDDQDRFRTLKPGDLALFEFEGRPAPSALRLVLLSRGDEQDAGICGRLDPFVGAASMSALEPLDLARAIDHPDVHIDHPVRVLLVDEPLEELALGGIEGARRLRARGARRRVGPDDLRRAKEAAEAVGALGEGLVYAHLKRRERLGEIADVRWHSQEDATSPFDQSFKVDEQLVLVEVKSTTGDFSRRIHLSAGELDVMANASPPCDLYRVYSADANGGRLRVAEDTSSVARTILDCLSRLPTGVTVDSVSLPPSLFDFGDEATIEPLADE